jgi:hypothetical protein
VTLQQNTDRIQTTHIGSLPRPHALLDLMKAKFSGQMVDEALLERTIATSVAECVRKQAECGIDIVTDGEFSKPGFFTYIQERLEGFESRPNQKLLIFQKETQAFPEYYADYFKQAMNGWDDSFHNACRLHRPNWISRREIRPERYWKTSRRQLRPLGFPIITYSFQRPLPPAWASTSITSPRRTISMPSQRNWPKNID